MMDVRVIPSPWQQARIKAGKDFTNFHPSEENVQVRSTPPILIPTILIVHLAEPSKEQEEVTSAHVTSLEVS